MLPVASAGRTSTLFFIGWLENSDTVISRHRLVFHKHKTPQSFYNNNCRVQEGAKTGLSQHSVSDQTESFSKFTKSILRISLKATAH